MRTTKREKEIIMKNSEELGITMSDYLLYLGTKKEITGFMKGAEFNKWINGYLFELNKIGTNFNQLVKQYNRRKGMMGTTEEAFFKEEWTAYRREMRDFQKNLINLLLKLGNSDDI